MAAVSGYVDGQAVVVVSGTGVCSKLNKQARRVPEARPGRVMQWRGAGAAVAHFRIDPLRASAAAAPQARYPSSSPAHGTSTRGICVIYTTNTRQSHSASTQHRCTTEALC